jgi:hypothetical protein
MEQPVLRLGLLGFGPADKFKVAEAISQPVAGGPSWELVEFEQADAWCINGAAVERLDGNKVMVRTLQVTQPLISLDPSEIKRPVAFTEPMPTELDAAEIVSFKTPQLLRVGLQRFEAWLRPVRAQFALGSELIAREQELKPGIYHVLEPHGTLLAVVNLFKWTVAMLPLARPVDFEDASWVQRPPMAADTPPGFKVMSVVELMWTYAVRTTHNSLPQRYRKDTIYLRKLPELPPGWLQDEHLVALRALSSGPSKFADLREMTELTDTILSQTLAALYFAGAITTRRESAAHIGRARSPVGDLSSLPPDSIGFGHGVPDPRKGAQNSGHGRAGGDATAPAPLFSLGLR